VRTIGEIKMTELTHLSLFSGIGGLDLAAEAAGFQTVGQCEWADYPTKVLEKHWPDVPRWRDIRTLTGDDIYAKTGRRSVTVISGGFPCQPFSVAGKRRGKEDDRYLWPEMCRVISEIRPSWVIGENVPGIVNLALDTVLSDLESQGYTCQTFIIPACGVDAPHRRERIFIVAYSGCGRCSGARNVCDIWELQKGSFGQGQADQFVQSGKVSTAVSNTDCDGSNSRRPEPEGQQREAGAANGGDDVADTSVKGIGSISVQPGEARSSDTDAHGSCKIVSDSESTGFQRYDHATAVSAERRGQGQSFAKSGALDANTDQQQRERKRGTWNWRPESADGGWWPVEPDVGRVANGVPSRVDRLKCLGNAVVPQQAYPIFKAIAEIERPT
jgi:DNA (cytosine-5)-methyltransferase 1